MAEDFNPRIAAEHELLAYLADAIEAGESERALAAIRERQAFAQEVMDALPRRRRAVRTEPRRSS
jgi:hypothetical protein